MKPLIMTQLKSLSQPPRPVDGSQPESPTLLQHSLVPFCSNAIFHGALIWKTHTILLFGQAVAEASSVVGDISSYHEARLNGERVLSMPREDTTGLPSGFCYEPIGGR